MNASNSPDLQLVDSTSQPDIFSSKLNDAISKTQIRCVCQSAQCRELSQDAAHTYLSPDGMAGVAVFRDGNIGAVFNKDWIL